jgi:hypothetical protein
MTSVYLQENTISSMAYLTTPEQWLLPQARENFPGARLEVLKAVLLKMQVSWDVMMWCWASSSHSSQHFKGL